MSTAARPLDPRAWIIWAVAANLPPLVGRNPWPLAATLLAMLGVWAAWSAGAAGARWRPLLRLALVFGAVSVLFNLLTAHIGDRAIGELPESWPVIGGMLTLNALVYGLLSAMAIFSSWQSAPRSALPSIGARPCASSRSGWPRWLSPARWHGPTSRARPLPWSKSGKHRWHAVIARAVSVTLRRW